MKKILVFMVLHSLITSCNNKIDKKEYLFSVMVCKGLYVETFQVLSTGVYGGDIHANYLTDSTNFRLFIGTYDDNQNFSYKCIKDSIYIEKIERNEVAETIPDKTKTVLKIVERKRFNLYNLKKEQRFE